MATVEAFPLPLSKTAPPHGFASSERSNSELSTITAFNAGVDARDTFGGKRRCVVCGELSRSILEYCHIIPEVENPTVSTWRMVLDASSEANACLVARRQEVQLDTVPIQETIHTRATQWNNSVCFTSWIV